MSQQIGSTSSPASAERRRLEAEMLMYQSDHAKLLRQRAHVETEKRMLKKEIEEKNLALVNKEAEERKVILDIQNLEMELLLLRKRFNVLK